MYHFKLFIKLIIFLPIAILILKIFRLFYKTDQKYTKKNIVFFQRNQHDSTNDAGARTVVELREALSEKIDIVTVEISWFEISFYKKLNSSNFCFVRTPEDAVILCALKLIMFKKCSILYYGGDIHYNRLLSKISHDGKSIKNILQYFYYIILEPLVWKASYCNFSPSYEEVHIIKDINKNSFLLPVRLFFNYPEKYEKNTHDKILFLFVGGLGHLPNKDALQYIDEEIIDAYLEAFGDNFEILVVGRGWDKFEGKYVGQNLKFLGSVSDAELENLYQMVDFTLCPLRFGAGVKGKVIESMYYNVPVITTSIGKQGINCEYLVSNEDIQSQINYIKKLKDDERLVERTIEGYSDFLRKNYSGTKTRDIIMDLL